MMTIEQFCHTHGACQQGLKWALTTCKSLDDVWGEAKPDWLIWIATRRGVLDDKTLRLFAVFCARSVQHLTSDERSINAVDVAERYANWEATDDELAVARTAARDAAEDAARAAWDTEADAEAAARSAARAAWAATWGAARVADRAAREAAWAARDAARDAALAASRDAEYAARVAWAAWGAARDEQAKWLRANATPCWEEVQP